MEKETLVLDASVIVKWFCEEEYTDIALGLRDRFYDNVYLAVGRFKRCNLITADKIFRDKINKSEVLFIGELR